MSNLHELHLETWPEADLHVLERAFSGSPAHEHVNRELLEHLSYLILTAAERTGLALSCYSDAAEHALHPTIPAQRLPQHDYENSNLRRIV